MVLSCRTESPTHGLRHVGLVLALLVAVPLASACGTDQVGAGEASDAPRASEHPDHNADDHAAHSDHASHPDESFSGVSSEPLGTLASETPDGTPVRLTLDPDPPSAGSVLLRIQIDGEIPDPAALSVDLVAPRMPAHGIVRFSVRVTDAGKLESEIRIPMEGTWVTYVNLDAGAQAAPFEFPVSPGKGDHHHDGHEHNDGHEPHGDHDHGDLAIQRGDASLSIHLQEDQR